MYKTKINVNEPNNVRPTDKRSSGLSCGKRMMPNKYKANVKKIPIQIAKNNSRSKKCACKDKSAFDKNLNAKANSKNPKTTFTEFNQPPDFGKVFIHPGNAANNPKGKAKAKEKPNIPINGAVPPADAA